MEKLELKKAEREERECPVCGDSGPCYACERGQALIEESKKLAKKSKKPGKS